MKPLKTETIIFNKQRKRAIKELIHISSRVALIEIKAKQFYLNIIQAYASTAESR